MIVATPFRIFWIDPSIIETADFAERRSEASDNKKAPEANDVVELSCFKPLFELESPALIQYVELIPF